MQTFLDDISIDDVSREQSITRWWPAFSTRMERLYRLEDADNNHKIVALSWLIGLGLSELFLINDYFVSGQDFKMYLIGRLG